MPRLGKYIETGRLVSGLGMGNEEWSKGHEVSF